MKKLFPTIILLLLFISPFSSSFADERDISTPDKALLGHWGENTGMREFYFTEDRFIQVNRNDDRTPFSYVIFSSNNRDGILEIRANRPSLDGYYRKFEFETGAYGLSTWIKILAQETYVPAGKWFYIDDKKEP